MILLYAECQIHCTKKFLTALNVKAEKGKNDNGRPRVKTMTNGHNFEKL